jgi:hypothetical protein
VKKGVAVLAFPSKLVWAEIESIYSLDIHIQAIMPVKNIF